MNTWQKEIKRFLHGRRSHELLTEASIYVLWAFVVIVFFVVTFK